MSASIAIRYFAAARELCGRDSESFAADDGLTVATLLAALGARHPRFAPVAQRMRAAVNGTLALGSQPLHPGDVVDVLPPLAGGAGPARVRDTALSVDEVIGEVARPGAGGVAIFLGTVRDHADGNPVERLDYEAHPQMAPAEIEAIEREVMRAHEGARVCIVHRVGSLSVGDLAVVVAASAPHRAEAFAACRLAIEEVKRRVPIWKKEWHPDGDSTWVNLEGE